MSTEEEIGYHDAMRQMHRSLQRRLKALQEESENASATKQQELSIRMSEVKHILQIVESLHR